MLSDSGAPVAERPERQTRGSENITQRCLPIHSSERPEEVRRETRDGRRNSRDRLRQRSAKRCRAEVQKSLQRSLGTIETRDLQKNEHT